MITDNDAPPHLNLSDIARAVSGKLVNAPDPLLRVESVVFRGMHDQRNSLFVAVRGTAADGHDFIRQALDNGALGAVVEREEALDGHTGIVVRDSRRALSRIAAIFAGEPTRDMAAVGVTGTNGKTTIHWLLFHLLGRLAIPTVRIGTLGISAKGIVDSPGSLTTPDPVQLQQVLQRCRAGGIKALVMEASSHALDQARVEDIAFDVGVFTNLTRDHLDYHLTMERYLEAKAHLFELTRSSGKPKPAAVINADDEAGVELARRLANAGLELYTYGFAAGSRIELSDFTCSLRESEFTVKIDGVPHRARCGFIGRHNASNIAAVIGAALALGFDAEGILAELGSLPQVPGRLESVGSAECAVFVDYAHTPDALENVLTAVRPSVVGTLWVVFGCGGDRDKGKRPLMAEAAVRHADRVVVTSDNPRTEEPRAIIADILASGISPYFVEPDRRAAIRRAIAEARPGDVIVIAGKGHEDYQIIGTEKVPFSDAEVAADALALRDGT